MRELDKIHSMLGNNTATLEEIFREGSDYILKIIYETDEYECTVNTSEEKYGAFRWIMQHKQYLKINGMIVDHFTGSAVWQVIHALNEESRNKFLSFSIEKMVAVTWNIFK